jgi:pimeloyl-ACP methyl ester carboxylesterase
MRLVNVALLSALALLVAGSARGAPTAKLVDPHPCPGEPGFTCSTLAVPLDRTGRRPGTLDLQVAAADNKNAPRGVLLLITGGPGQPGAGAATRVTQALSAVLSDYRLVLYDQRGTGGGALQCPALQDAMGSSDLTPPPASAVRSCARALGAARAYFGTDDVVADMDALRKALGVDTWTLDGVSYGTYVGERYALAHPGNVKRLVLDSVVPHNFDYSLVPVEFRAVGRALRAACGARCVSDLAAVVKKQHLGPQLLDALTLLSIVDPTYRKSFDVGAILHEARQGHLAQLRLMLRTATVWQSAPADLLSQGLHASALCADWRWPWGSSTAPVTPRAAKLARAAARLKTKELAPFDRATFTGNGFVRQCLPWTPTEPTPTAARKLPAVPTLLINGDHDLSTPLEWARREAKLIPGSRLVVVHGAGHSVQVRAVSDAGRNAVAAFLTG